MRELDRRSMPLFSIGVVKTLTELTARQIRYYENHQLIHPSRSKGNQRLFSFHDVDRLLEIKELMDKGLNVAGIKQETEKYAYIPSTDSKEITKRELRKMLQHELFYAKTLRKTSLRQGELSRFFY